MKEKRVRITFYGRVQGVGFRYRAYHIARALGITGYVRNNYDGTVEVELQGSSEAIDTFYGMINNQRYIDIEYMDIRDMEPVSDERGFGIRD
ncbi:MAG: acylphosphatase [Lachnospiraceae bacterium]|nr:acylphosphatase [Lachnospiraceae bacterium]